MGHARWLFNGSAPDIHKGTIESRVSPGQEPFDISVTGGAHGFSAQQNALGLTQNQWSLTSVQASVRRPFRGNTGVTRSRATLPSPGKA